MEDVNLIKSLRVLTLYWFLHSLIYANFMFENDPSLENFIFYAVISNGLSMLVLLLVRPTYLFFKCLYKSGLKFLNEKVKWKN